MRYVDDFPEIQPEHEEGLEKNHTYLLPRLQNDFYYS